ncbi:MAG: hypothetical protein C0593_06715 [Marinilabiliales bacterium]|nr:MAG: hypothetical protein C0593_06715 [Marinilabiliales bacterium]
MIMKHYLILLLLAVLIFGVGCGNNKKDSLPADIVTINKSADPDNIEKKEPRIVFEKDTHDFGRVVQGEKVTYGFKFKNEGNKDLLIVKVNATCGCTVIDYPRDPIAPGAEGVLHVTFNSTAKKGLQNKKVTVMANTQPSNTYLWVKANVAVD